ncbi:MAG: hypothetical protein H6675_02760 [Dehalococcoidia bacterium]|nr:hypothetical protein [Dehalococcoidia bacterium]
MTRRPALIAGTAVAVLAALFSTACKSESKPLTAEQAESLAQAGLLTQEDLPSAEWTVTDGPTTDGEQGDGPPDANTLFADTEACRDLEAAINAAGFSTADAAEDAPLAETERSFDFDGGDSLVARSVQSSIAVPQDPKEIEAGFEALRKVMTADGVRPCFESAFTESLGGEDSGVTISSIEVTDIEKVTEDGVAIGLDLQAVAFIIPINLHMEMHMWPEGPAAGQLMIMELNSETLKDASADIREAARTRLAEAVKANK